MSLISQINSAFSAAGAKCKALGASIGSLTSLTTTAKTDVVSAINEVNAKTATMAVGTILEAIAPNTTKWLPAVGGTKVRTDYPELAVLMPATPFIGSDMTGVSQLVTNRAQSATYGNGVLLFAYSNGGTVYIMYSPNSGGTFTAGATISVTSAPTVFMSYANGVFLACPSAGSAIWTNTTPQTGAVWTSRNVSPTNMIAHAYNATLNKHTLVNGTGQISSSTDNAVTWTSGTNISGTGTVTGLWYFAGVYLCVRSTTGIMYSTDLVTWTASNVPAGFTGTSAVGGTNGTVFCFANSNGGPITSTDGINWTQRSMLSALNPAAIYGLSNGTLFIRTAGTASTYSSTDNGVTWNTTSAEAGITASTTDGTNIYITTPAPTTAFYRKLTPDASQFSVPLVTSRSISAIPYVVAKS